MNAELQDQSEAMQQELDLYHGKEARKHPEAESPKRKKPSPAKIRDTLIKPFNDKTVLKIMDSVKRVVTEPNIKSVYNKLLQDFLSESPGIAGILYNISFDENTIEFLSHMLSELKDSQLSDQVGEEATDEEVHKSLKLMSRLEVFKEAFIDP